MAGSIRRKHLDIDIACCTTPTPTQPPSYSSGCTIIFLAASGALWAPIVGPCMSMGLCGRTGVSLRVVHDRAASAPAKANAAAPSPRCRSRAAVCCQKLVGGPCAAAGRVHAKQHAVCKLCDDGNAAGVGLLVALHRLCFRYYISSIKASISGCYSRACHLTHLLSTEASCACGDCRLAPVTLCRQLPVHVC